MTLRSLSHHRFQHFPPECSRSRFPIPKAPAEPWLRRGAGLRPERPSPRKKGRPACGCPARREPVLSAAATSGQVVPEENAGTKFQMTGSTDPQPRGDTPATTPVSNSGLGEAPGQQTKSGDMQVQLEAPLVFSGRELAESRKHP